MKILGQVAEDGDGDPVQTRWQQIWLTQLAGDLGYKNSPVYYNWIPGSGYQWWQYFSTLGFGDFPPTGMIACGINNCACAIYGTLFNYYDGQQQFEGPLGFPTSDVTQLPDGSSYVVFDNGVLLLDTQGNVTRMRALPASLVQSLSKSLAFPNGVDPSVNGITALAGQKVQQFADNALQTNQQLSDQVSSINASTSFDHVNVGSCMNQHPVEKYGSQPGVCRQHVFKVHFDFNLKGCAGIFGGASADTTVTVHLAVNTPGVQVFMDNFSIDNISSPFGQGQDQIKSGLTQAFNNVYGQDLLGASLPKGFSIIAVLVDDAGNATIYIQSICTASTALARVEPNLKDDALTRLRRLRDDFLVHQSYGTEFMLLVDTVGPTFLAHLSAEKDALKLLPTVAGMISAVDPDDTSVHQALNGLAPRMVHLQQIASQSERFVLQHVLASTIEFVRRHIAAPLTFTQALKKYAPVIEHEIKAAEAQPRRSLEPS